MEINRNKWQMVSKIENYKTYTCDECAHLPEPGIFTDKKRMSRHDIKNHLWKIISTDKVDNTIYYSCRQCNPIFESEIVTTEYDKRVHEKFHLDKLEEEEYKREIIAECTNCSVKHGITRGMTL